MNERHDYVSQLTEQAAPKVWLALSGNGSLRIDIDTDVQCYGPWGPHAADSDNDQVNEAQNWVEYFVRSTVNRLMDAGVLPKEKL